MKIEETIRDIDHIALVVKVVVVGLRKVVAPHSEVRISIFMGKAIGHTS
jgi:putative N-acetylmannosamine-6-phosphate epimerase